MHLVTVQQMADGKMSGLLVESVQKNAFAIVSQWDL